MKIGSCTSKGFALWNGGAAKLSNCDVATTEEEGVWVDGVGCQLDMDSCSVAKSEKLCVVYSNGAQGTLNNCTLSHSVGGILVASLCKARDRTPI